MTAKDFPCDQNVFKIKDPSVRLILRIQKEALIETSDQVDLRIETWTSLNLYQKVM